MRVWGGGRGGGVGGQETVFYTGKSVLVVGFFDIGLVWACTRLLQSVMVWYCVVVARVKPAKYPAAVRLAIISGQGVLRCAHIALWLTLHCGSHCIVAHNIALWLLTLHCGSSLKV